MQNQNNPVGMPVYPIEGTNFFIDVKHERFIEVNDPENHIPFNRIREIEDSYFGFDYDPVRRKVAYTSEQVERSVEIVLPNELVFAPKEFAEKAIHDKTYTTREIKKVNDDLQASINRMAAQTRLNKKELSQRQGRRLC